MNSRFQPNFDEHIELKLITILFFSTNKGVPLFLFFLTFSIPEGNYKNIGIEN